MSRLTVTILHQSICTQFVLFDPKIGPYQVLPFRVRVDPGAMKGYSKFPKSSRLDCLNPGHWSLRVFLPLSRDAVNISYIPSRLGWFNVEVTWSTNVMGHRIGCVALCERIASNPSTMSRNRLKEKISRKEFPTIWQQYLILKSIFYYNYWKKS